MRKKELTADARGSVAQNHTAKRGRRHRPRPARYKSSSYVPACVTYGTRARGEHNQALAVAGGSQDDCKRAGRLGRRRLARRRLGCCNGTATDVHVGREDEQQSTRTD